MQIAISNNLNTVCFPIC